MRQTSTPDVSSIPLTQGAWLEPNVSRRHRPWPTVDQTQATTFTSPPLGPIFHPTCTCPGQVADGLASLPSVSVKLRSNTEQVVFHRRPIQSRERCKIRDNEKSSRVDLEQRFREPRNDEGSSLSPNSRGRDQPDARLPAGCIVLEDDSVFKADRPLAVSRS